MWPCRFIFKVCVNVWFSVKTRGFQWFNKGVRLRVTDKNALLDRLDIYQESDLVHCRKRPQVCSFASNETLEISFNCSVCSDKNICGEKKTVRLNWKARRQWE